MSPPLPLPLADARHADRVLAAASSPYVARAQQVERTRHVGVLMGLADNPLGQTYAAALLEGLQALGWTDGRNIRINIRWAAGSPEKARAFARELIDGGPDLIVAQNTAMVAAVVQETRTLPIVFVNVADPVGNGFVVSYPRPGGNITGFTGYEPSLAGKWLGLLKEVAPRVNRAALVFNPDTGPGVHIPACCRGHFIGHEGDRRTRPQHVRDRARRG